MVTMRHRIAMFLISVVAGLVMYSVSDGDWMWGVGTFLGAFGTSLFVDRV